MAAAEDVTQRRANPFLVRTSASSAQCCRRRGDYAAKELKYKRAATIAEGGFRERRIQDVQLLLAKPGYRAEQTPVMSLAA